MFDIVHVTMPGVLGADHVNSYLLLGDSVTLFDTGPRNDDGIARIRDALTDRGRDLSDIDTIFITHPHSDHFGNAARLQEETGAQVLMHEGAAPIVADYAAHQAKMDRFYSDYFALMGMPEEEAQQIISANLPDPTTVSFTVDQPLSPGETITINGTDIACVDAPGHAAGNMVFQLPDCTFLGDTVLADITPNPGLQLPDEGDTPPPSLRWYLDTLERLQSRTFGTGYGGHGPPMDDVPARIQEILAHHRQRKKRLHNMIQEEARTPYELMHALFEDLPREQYYFGMSEIVGHLTLLEDDGTVDAVKENGSVTYHAVPR